MCRSFTLTFTCTPSHPSHKISFSQPCRKCPSSSSPDASSRTGLSLTKSLSRALEPKPDPAVLRAYKFAANRPCEECDPEHRPIGEPPGLEDLEGGLGDRHTFGVDEATKSARVWGLGLRACDCDCDLFRGEGGGVL